jgi:hypothetical protein
MKTWEDIYVLPLEKDSYGSQVYDQRDNFVFQFEEVNEKNQQDILNILNGFQNPTVEHSFVNKDGEIWMDGERHIITIRGWGNLTGTGAHNLPEDEAANIQDTFAAWIIEKLTKK